MESINSAYKVLDYLLTRAAVSSKPGTSTIRIPYKELLTSIGQKTDKDIDLLVTISLSWDEAQVESETIDEFEEELFGHGDDEHE